MSHHFIAGDDGCTMLVYGTRKPNDMCFYPRSNKISWRGLGVIARVEPLEYWDGEPRTSYVRAWSSRSSKAPRRSRRSPRCAGAAAFVFPSSDIYGGLGSSFDFGHYGVLLNDNVKSEWRRSLIQEREDVVALDSAIILNPQVWVASGHVDGVLRPARRLPDLQAPLPCRQARATRTAAGGRRSGPASSRECDLTEPRQFNLMFETHVGPLADDASRAYLRPETAQGIFVNFKNVTSSMRVKPPFGIAQIGKSFRNEITPGNFLFRLREFEQMEMEFFVHPAEAAEWHAYWIEQRLQLASARSGCASRTCAFANTKARSCRTTRPRRATSSTSTRSAGRSSRASRTAATTTCGSTSRHSGTKLEWIGHDERYVPHVIEPAISVDRSCSRSSATHTTRRWSPTGRAPCCGSTRALLRSRPRCCR